MKNNSQDVVLTQMLQRLPVIANIQDSDFLEDIQKLMIMLYQASKHESGIVTIAEVDEQLESSIAALQQAFPQLFDSSTGIISVFSSFISFTSYYRQLQFVVDWFAHHNSYKSLKRDVFQMIKWQVASKQECNNEHNTEQKMAALAAATQSFCLITGGAGTGKTTTLTKALELMLLDTPDIEIVLVAPTGKAAQRLNESLQSQLTSVNPIVCKQLQRLEATTIHRLLGISEHSSLAFRNENNPLTCQVLVIDEASMISLDLFKKIISALPSNSSLIIMGDPNQLPPVNATGFFKDISRIQCTYTNDFIKLCQRELNIAVGIETNIDANNEHRMFANQICHLKTTNRFSEQSVIELSANAVLNNDAALLIEVLGKDYYRSLNSASELYQQLADIYPVKQEELLSVLSRHIILCANRKGEYGCDAINNYLDSLLRERLSDGYNNQEWYVGRKILIEKNYFDLNLNNGDIGTCCYGEDGQWYIAFDEDSTVKEKRRVNVEQLPQDYSLAFAITIHKSQGSEYDCIDIVLDADSTGNAEEFNPLITPTLTYTAITRARNSLTLFAGRKTLDYALEQKSKTTEGKSPFVALLASR